MLESEQILEEKFIENLCNNDYEYVNVKNKEDLEANFKIQLEKLNKDKLKGTSFSDDEFKKILLHLKDGSIFDKAEKLRDRFTIKREGEVPFNIKFLDQEDWCNNIFQVANQVRMKGSHENRYDVTLLINGLPLVQVELKRRGMPIKNAFNQVKRYMKHSYSGLFNYIQLFVISNGVNTRYFANGRPQEVSMEFIFQWKDKYNNNINNLNDFTNSFLKPCNIAKMISKYMVLNKSSKKLMVLRAYQKHAVEAIINQALEVKQNGYIWHSTGSGKTLTSFKASQLLAEDPSIHKVIFVVDRLDLDDQTNKEFNKFCPKCVNSSESTIELVNNLLDNNVSSLITTIQKLSNAVTNEKDMDKLSKIKDENIILVYDECHRGHFGKMHANITKFFTNSLAYGFTGTPIFKENSADGIKTTESVFNHLLHWYLTKDAIADNNILPFSVSYLEGDSQDYYNINRLNQIVDYILENYDQKTRNKEFNAMFTVPPKGFVHEYYKLFKEKNSDLKIATIFSVNDNEDEDSNREHSRDLLDSYIDDYNEMFGTNYSSHTFDAYRRDISQRMENREIDLLLVIDMYLTGFDCPVLNTLFVDRDLKHHKLMQTFSRTNRIYNERKTNAEVICFRDIKENVDEAITLFSHNDSTDTILLEPYEQYVKNFNEFISELYKLVPTAADVDNLQSEAKKKQFVSNFNKILHCHHMLETFIQFDFDDLNIEEQEFADYKSAYFDLHHQIKKSRGNEDSELSVDDFVLSFIRADLINVDYILELLSVLNPDNPNFEKQKEEIIGRMKEHPSLLNKIDLIEKFVNEHLQDIDGTISVKEEFDSFMVYEKERELYDIIDKEDLDSKIIRDVLEDYEYDELFDDELIEDSFNEELLFIERLDKIEEIKIKLKELKERFEY